MTELHDWGTGQPPNPRSYPMSYPLDHRPKWHVMPRTLDDLMQRAGPYAEAARLYVEWGAVTSWHMRAGADKLIAEMPTGAASLSVLLTRKAEEKSAGWPNLTGIDENPAIYDLPEDAQFIARRIAGEVRSLWEADGRPYLDANSCKSAFQYLVACIRKGLIPPVSSIGDVSPIAPAAPAKPHILNMFKENQ